MEITNSKLSNYILYSNKNLEKLCRSFINESANAVLLESYNDKLLLADHNTGAIYLADYKFDGKVLTVENYEHVDLINDRSNLREAVENYFDSDGYDVASIAEAYAEDSEAQNTDLNESIVEALASKKNEVTNYTELYGINEEIGDVKDMTFFKNYKTYLESAPTESIKFFDWVNPVRATILDKDVNRTIVGNAKAKAAVLAKDNNFKKMFAEAAADMMEGYSGTMETLLEDNSAILALENVEFKEFVGISVIGNKDLTSNRKAVLETIDNIVAESEYLSETKMLFEEEETAAAEEGAEAEASLSTSDKDIDALKDALDKALEKITDEKLVSKINSLKDALDTSKDSGTTDVGTVKECVELLSF